ncbi:hypothetical protein V8C42DRAFT_349563 [Trichoderma barbatum]
MSPGSHNSLSISSATSVVDILSMIWMQNMQILLSLVLDGRTAQAILRRQLLVYMHGGKYNRPRDHPRFVKADFSLFHLWKLAQILDIDHFLGDLLGSLADYQMRKRGPNGERSPVRWQF